ncbi:FAD:protein FMN transferase [Agromyces tropicus]|uniref:FAD:protein FMN transferase n=1 Tax=Agromyces tropicus TaxID=555371 RepID=A0ABN2UUM5_9MICO
MAVHVFDAMGTTVSIRTVDDSTVPGAGLARTLDEVRACFERLEQACSLYRPDSELSRVARGELSVRDASRVVRDAYAAALDWRTRTMGTFTPHRPDGVVDLSGLVKAEAIAGAGDVLRSAGISSFAVNAGGDVLTSGAPGGGYWTTGISDPADRTRLLAGVRSGPAPGAVATSGSSERGAHIWTAPAPPEGRRPADVVVQATVLADDIVTADVLATAIVAGGRAALDHATDTAPIGVLAVFADGDLAANARLRRRIVR